MEAEKNVTTLSEGDSLVSQEEPASVEPQMLTEKGSQEPETKQETSDKPEESMENKPEESTEDKPEEGTENKPEESTEDKPEECTEDKSEECTEDKTEEKAAEKTEEEVGGLGFKKFSEATDIDPRILRAVRELGFEDMTPIQEQAIPILMSGRDVIGQAQTGTGKTAAFGIPMIQRIDPENRALQALVLCPTRELAMQAADELRKFSKYMHGIKVVPIYGGADITKQIYALKGGVSIVVGTPGRVMDHMRRHTLSLEQVNMVILDEADEMLDMGFREDIETILEDTPTARQTALFSATMPAPILEITRQYQHDAVYLKITPQELTIPLVRQYYYRVDSADKAELACRLLDYYGLNRALIFCNTKRMVDELSEEMKNRGYAVEGLHGDLVQSQRDVVMHRFRNGGIRVLIATDVAARGIDVDDVEAVFNYDLPQESEYYVHRIGRTGRAGKEGCSFTFVSRREMYKLRQIERLCNTTITERKPPEAADIVAIRARRVLGDAEEMLKKEELSQLYGVLIDRLSEDGYAADEIATALLRILVGEPPKEITVAEPPRRSRRRGGGFDAEYADRGARRQRGDRGRYTRGGQTAYVGEHGRRGEESGYRRENERGREDGGERRREDRRREDNGIRRGEEYRGEDDGTRREKKYRSGEDGTHREEKYPARGKYRGAENENRGEKKPIGEDGGIRREVSSRNEDGGIRREEKSRGGENATRRREEYRKEDDRKRRGGEYAAEKPRSTGRKKESDSFDRRDGTQKRLMEHFYGIRSDSSRQDVPDRRREKNRGSAYYGNGTGKETKRYQRGEDASYRSGGKDVDRRSSRGDFDGKERKDRKKDTYSYAYFTDSANRRRKDSEKHKKSGKK